MSSSATNESTDGNDCEGGNEGKREQQRREERKDEKENDNEDTEGNETIERPDKKTTDDNTETKETVTDLLDISKPSPSGSEPHVGPSSTGT